MRIFFRGELVHFTELALEQYLAGLDTEVFTVIYCENFQSNIYCIQAKDIRLFVKGDDLCKLG